MSKVVLLWVILSESDTLSEPVSGSVKVKLIMLVDFVVSWSRFLLKYAFIYFKSNELS